MVCNDQLSEHVCKLHKTITFNLDVAPILNSSIWMVSWEGLGAATRLIKNY